MWSVFSSRLSTIRVRITLWYLLVITVMLVLFSLGVGFALRRSLENSLDASIESRSQTILDLLQVEESAPALPDTFVNSLAVQVGDDDERPDFAVEQYVRSYADDGTVVSDAGGMDFEVPPPDDAVRTALNGDASWRQLSGENETYRVLLRPIIADGRVIGVLEVGQSTEEVSEAIGTLSRIVFVALPLTLVVAMAGGYFLAARALRPIDRLTATARRISAEDLGTRIPVIGPADEVGRLARTFNDMIARLDAAFRRQKQFTADASHELRTPLTAMKGQVEVTLSRPRSAEEYQAALGLVGEETDRLMRLVGTLLTLARADAGEIPLDREPIDVHDLIEGVIDQVAPLAEERKVALLMLPGPIAIIAVDQSLVVQLLLNLLDNALRHTGSGGEVIVTWRMDAAGQVAIDVRDTGVGISPEHLPHIFDRFYRVDTARTSGRSGAGLGLAISRWVVEAHGGRISAASEPGRGTTITIAMPVSTWRS